MRKIFLCFLLLMVAGTTMQAQTKKQVKAKADSLKVTIFGDSYSTYEGYLTPDTNEVWYFAPGPRKQKNNDVSRVEETWWWQVIDRMGWKLERNNSYSGSTVCCTGYNKDDYTPRAFITRMPNLGEPDIILICAATNDSWCGAPVGEYKYGEWTKEELYSFRPAMAKLCWGLKANYPTARILFMLNSELKEETNESIRTILKHYNIPLLELKNVDKQAGHPSVAGMKSIADQVVKYFSK